MATITTYTKAEQDIMQGRNCVYLDDYTGATDDIKLANARSDALAQTNIPAIIIGRNATFSTSFDAAEGLKIWGFVGDLGVTDYELNSGKNLPIKITVSS